MKIQHKISLTKEELLSMIRTTLARREMNYDLPDDAEITLDTGECYNATVDTITPLEITWETER